MAGAILIGADAGYVPLIREYTGVPAVSVRDVWAFDPSYSGGVRVAVGDVDGDGVPDLIAGAGLGSSQVSVYSGSSGSLIRAFLAFAGFSGGVFAAAGDVNGDGRDEVIVAPDAGGGQVVSVFDGMSGSLLSSWYVFDTAFRGGVRVATADLDGDGRADIVVGAGPGGGPVVKVYNGATRDLLLNFFAFDPDFSGGTYVAAGDVNGDALAELVVGAGAGASPFVRVFQGKTGNLITSFLAYSAGFTGGVRVGVTDCNDDGVADIVTGTGGSGTLVNLYSGGSYGLMSQFIAFESAPIGIFVAGTPFTPPAHHLFVDAPAQAGAGSAVALTVTAQDVAGQRVRNYRRKVQFARTGPAASVPDTYTFGTGDAGQRAFSVTPHASGPLVLSVSDLTVSSVTGVAAIAVSPASPAQSGIACDVKEGIEIQLDGTPWAAYRIEAATGLTGKVAWQPLHTNTLDGSGTYRFVDPLASNYPTRFYRIVSE